MNVVCISLMGMERKKPEIGQIIIEMQKWVNCAVKFSVIMDPIYNGSSVIMDQVPILSSLCLSFKILEMDKTNITGHASTRNPQGKGGKRKI